MKEIEKQAKKELVEFYKSYVDGEEPELIKEKASQLQQRFLTATALLGDKVNQALGKLVDFYAETGVNPPSKEEAKKIVENLSRQK
jgi:hypothetical protein